MGIAPRHPIAPSPYLTRPAERLVLEGYRYWIHGTVLRSTVPWTHAQRLYRGLLGNADGEKAILALANFTRTLGQCAICPPNVCRAGSMHLCHDEALVMGLIAGFQNGDARTVNACMDALCRSSLFDRLGLAAGGLALTLKQMGQVLLPVPAGLAGPASTSPATRIMSAHKTGTVH